MAGKGLLNYTTGIAVSKTAAEVQHALAKAGADAIMAEYRNGEPIALNFAIDTVHGRRGFKLPVDAEPVWRVLQRQADAGKIPRNKATAEQAARRMGDSSRPCAMRDLHGRQDQDKAAAMSETEQAIAQIKATFGGVEVTDYKPATAPYKGAELVQFSAWDRAEMRKWAETKERHSGRNPNVFGEGTGADKHYQGLLGEWAVADSLGIERPRRPEQDGYVDLWLIEPGFTSDGIHSTAGVSAQVKYDTKRHGLIFAEAGNQRFLADIAIYALANTDEWEPDSVWIVGWTIKERADLDAVRKNYGYGPRLVIPPPKLRRWPALKTIITGIRAGTYNPPPSKGEQNKWAL